MATHRTAPIDRRRWRVLRRGFVFPPWRVAGAGQPLATAGLKPDRELIVFERGGQALALPAGDLVFHHVAQGALAGQPYLITF